LKLKHLWKNSGVDLIYNLNAMQRKQQTWDPSNSRLLMKFMIAHGIRVAGWELGNGKSSEFTQNNFLWMCVSQFFFAYNYCRTKQFQQIAAYDSERIRIGKICYKNEECSSRI